MEPMDWLEPLSQDLNKLQPVYQLYDEYYDGHHRRTFEPADWRENFGDRLAEYRDNWCQVIVDAVEERLNVDGFLFPDEEADEGQADADAWRIWQWNQMDADSQVAHTEALINGRCPVLVWFPPGTEVERDGRYVPPPGSFPRISVEHPSQVIVAYAATDRRKREAALKRWVAKDERLWVTLYLPDRVVKLRSKHAATTVGWATDYDAFESRGEDVVNPLGVVPVVDLQNRARVLSDPKSEIADVIPNQDAINEIRKAMLVATDLMAFPARVATGVEIPTDEKGDPLPGWKPPTLARFLAAEDPQARFDTLDAADLKNYVTAFDSLLSSLASQTRLPPHYLNSSADRLSGESIKSAETGLVAKVRRKQRHFGESWEEVMRLAFRIMGDPRSGQMDAETQWADPESRTESQHIDAVAKMRESLDLPRKSAWREAGFGPTRIAQMERELMSEAMSAQGVDLESLLADDDGAE